MTQSTRDRFLAFRRSLPRTPRLERLSLRSRGLDFAVWCSPAVLGTTPLLCINGGLLYGHDLLWPALSPLAGKRQLIFYDQRGRGQSSAPPGTGAARIEHDAGDVGALREALGIEQWDLLGHSWGAGIAMLAAADDTGGTRRLVLVDPVGPTSEWLPAMHERALERLAPARRLALEPLDPAMLSHPDAGWHSTYSRAFYPAWFADQEFSSSFTPPRANSPTGAVVAARLRREGYDWRPAIANISARTLIVHGAEDPVPEAEARLLGGLVKGSHISIIPRCGHMPFWEAPTVFFPLVDSFLAEP